MALLAATFHSVSIMNSGDLKFAHRVALLPGRADRECLVAIVALN